MRLTAVSAVVGVVIAGTLGVIPAGALWSVPGSMTASVQTDRLAAPPAPTVAARAANSLTFNLATPGQKSDTLPTEYMLERSATQDFSDSVMASRGEATRVVDTGGSFPPDMRDYGFDSISIGSSSACGLREGSVWCWGENSLGQLGQGTTTGFSATPVAVKTSTEASSSSLPLNARLTRVNVGENVACATDGTTVWCWGSGNQLLLGISGGVANTATIAYPRQIPRGSLPAGREITDLSVGRWHACVVVKDGGGHCWGRDNSGEHGVGQISSGSNTPRRIFTAGTGGSQVPANATITSVVAGYARTCIVASGAAYCTGYNPNGAGQGNGSTTFNVTAMQRVMQGGNDSQIPALATITEISLPQTSVIGSGSATTGSVGACVIADGRPYCWGGRAYGGVGDGGAMTGFTLYPRAVVGIPDGETRGISSAPHNSCVVHSSGDSYCWGVNGSGQMGAGNTTAQGSAVVVPTPLGKTIKAISSSTYSAALTDSNTPTLGNRCWLFTDGTAGCAGRGVNGLLGEGPEGRLNAINSTVGSVVAPQIAVCEAGAVSLGARCILLPGTGYFYRLSYSIGEWQSPLSEVFRVETTAR
ncbi:hypothetical protein [Lysinibacter sp. HNR]|uniref:RCC1 domain-containing protein n=1 Tax=Lysinibacter sp. HNR TaxID=3031408 RepID=UPI002434D9E0|nr:hypothetical protein [Lysinibacter sp. HNR]WGD37463.1 hypothetical protein FrondiHNR_00640 [Lysinibacter sp. HNR]